MILSDGDLHGVLNSGELTISPLSRANIQPASIDLRLSAKFRIYPNRVCGHVDPLVEPTEQQEMVEQEVIPGSVFPLPPGGFALASTIEKVTIGPSLVGLLAGKSSLARCGLIVEAAGWIDPGWSGELTYELFNMSNRTLALTPGMLIAQLAVARLSSPCGQPYGHEKLGSKYQNQAGPTPSRAFRV